MRGHQPSPKEPPEGKGKGLCWVSSDALIGGTLFWGGNREFLDSKARLRK